MPLEELEVAVNERIRKKLQRAEGAFIKAHSQKETSNCRHHGPLLSDNMYVCKISCIGTDARSAGACFNQKARACDEFSLKRSVETRRAEFRAFTEDEIAIRNPHIGELFWMRNQIKAQLSQPSIESRKTG